MTTGDNEKALAIGLGCMAFIVVLVSMALVSYGAKEIVNELFDAHTEYWQWLGLVSGTTAIAHYLNSVRSVR